MKTEKLKLTDRQIEIVATIFSKGNEYHLSDMDAEWLLGHAFQLGAKFYRDFMECNQETYGKDA
jgi:hypothetical protein